MIAYPHSCCPADLEFIKGSERVVALLGYWPCFHDGTLLGLNIRKDESDSGLAFVEITTTLQRMIPDVDENGIYKSIGHVLLRMQFENAAFDTLELSMFPVHIFSCAILRSSESANSLDVLIETEGTIRFSCALARVEEIIRLSP